jgi:predicted solute-binding protein
METLKNMQIQKYEFTKMMFEEFDEIMEDLRFEMQVLINKAEDYYGYDLSEEMRDALIDSIDVK